MSYPQWIVVTLQILEFCCLIASVFVAATYLAEDVPKGSLFKHNYVKMKLNRKE